MIDGKTINLFNQVHIYLKNSYFFRFDKFCKNLMGIYKK